jgi:glycosyltransferase involved in cell wall biosynthesis
MQTLQRQLVASGHTVTLVVPSYGEHTTGDADNVWRVPARNIYFDPEDRLMHFGATLKRLEHIKRGEIDIVHIHTPFVAHYVGLKIAKRLAVTCVETYHTYFEDYMHHYLPMIPKRLTKRLARGISRRQCGQVDALVVPSQPMCDVLKYYGVTSAMEVIPTGLEDSSFIEADGAHFRVKHGIPADRPMLLYVGRVAHEKNIGFLLRKLAILIKTHPDVLLVITGEGPAEANLKAEAQKLGLMHHVQFIGYLDRTTELNACYAAADIFVFASVTETQGLVLLEAMAQGTPVVAIAELGTASILREGFGALVAPHDEAGFAALVARLLDSKSERQVLAHSAKHYAHGWTSQAMASRMVSFYQKCIEVDG